MENGQIAPAKDSSPLTQRPTPSPESNVELSPSNDIELPFYNYSPFTRYFGEPIVVAFIVSTRRFPFSPAEKPIDRVKQRAN